MIYLPIYEINFHFEHPVELINLLSVFSLVPSGTKVKPDENL
jgi:hypothetical protein